MRVAPDRSDHSENVGIALSQNPIIAATASTVTLYSADGLIAVQEEHDGVIADVPRVVGAVSGDDDLTSLTWLQDNNLLKSVHELPKQEFNDDGANDSTLSNSSASNSSFRKTSTQCINVIPRLSYDPQVHVNSKPPFSFSCLIFMAIEDSDEKALPVKDIYVWIVDHFPYYRNAPTGWKNSVRHNLSLNKCFKKVDKLPHLGKGSLWMVEQRFRPCLIQALQKTPHHQYHKFIRNLNINKNTTTSTCDKAEANKLFPSNEIETTTITQKDLTTETICISENLDDVDAAATAMLVLKHGGYSFDVKAGDVDFVLQNDAVSAGGQGLIEITSELPNNCPNDDHNYGYHCSTSLKVNNSSCSPSALPNEKETLNSYWSSTRVDIEEQRKIVEGADALLNLAGIKTTTITKKRVASSILNDEQQQCNAKRPCMEQSLLYKPLMVRKDSFSTDVNSRRSINIADDDDGNTSNSIRPRSRATAVKKQPQRKKFEKKRNKF